MSTGKSIKPDATKRSERTLRAARRGIAWMMVGLLVSGALGCVRPDWIQSTLVTVDVSGEWQGNVTKPTASYGPSLIQLNLQQSGPKVTGTFSFSPGPSTSPGPTKDVPLEGTISGDVLSFRNFNGSVTAELQVNGDTMKGAGTLLEVLNGQSRSGPVTFDIHRRP